MKTVTVLLLSLVLNIYPSKFVVDSITIKNDLVPVEVKTFSGKLLDIKCFGGVLSLNLIENLYFYDSTYTFINRDTIPDNGDYKQVLLFMTPGDTIKTMPYGFWIMDKSEFANIHMVLDQGSILDTGTTLITRSSQTMRSARSKVWRQPTVTISEGINTLLVFMGHTSLDNSQGSTTGNITLSNLMTLLPDTYYVLEIDNRSNTTESVVTFFISWIEINPLKCPEIL